jgi:hypothetical protein
MSLRLVIGPRRHVRCVEQIADHSEQVGARRDHLRCIVQGDAADGCHRESGAAQGLSEQRERRGRRQRLGGRREDAAEGDVVGAGRARRGCALQVGVTGHADQGAGAEDGPRGDRICVVAPEMHAVCANFGDQPGIVVDHQRHPPVTAQRGQQPGLLPPQGCVADLAAVLDQACAAGQGVADLR